MASAKAPRQWLGATLMAAMLCGCSKPNPVVYVDLSKIPISAPPPTMAAPTPSTPLADSAAGGTLPAIPERNLFRGGSQERIKSALAMVEANRRRGIENQLDALQAKYLAEVDARAASAREELVLKHRALFDSAHASISALFSAYAAERGLPGLRLALRVGFPDPDPDSQRIADTRSLRQQRDYRIAKELRQEINKLDADYKAKALAILNRVEDQVKSDFAQLSRDLDSWRKEALDRARQEAEALAERVNRPFTGDLESSLQEKLGARPGVVVSIPAVRSTLQQPSVDPADATETWQEIARGQVRLWARLNGYTLVDRPGLGRDATQDFLAWRRTYQVGP
ncbi:MAG: hypothetical protein HONBIEJF_02224 [Fimbriimonadaceae bacterium]|nr:hypothetical protein [Fimbriimonadaceae bacterium]